MGYDKGDWVLEERKKGIDGKTGKIQIKCKYLINSDVPMPVS